MALFSNSEPPADELTLLAIGDVHLGTRPGSLPEDLHEQGVDPRALTPEAALRTTVERAIEARVDAVLFAGDVVESTNARLEAMRPLEAAVHSLLDAGIPVLGVAGNHDVEALPRLADLIEGFELIGRDGRWQTRVIEKHGRPAVEILGWSFPERKVRSSPVAELLRNPIERTHPARPPRIGLLHGDLDAPGGSYAPFSSRELERADLDAWLLGHIHKPTLPQGPSPDGSEPRGYLGSLVGLDPSETGPHGPWLVRVSRADEVVLQQLAIAPLRWERFE
ncbi:MAG: DNA repair exonuclease, partial [Deltaproteobacteria bacterium]|nr:DNA repair exonuclease [Deltaproteobacteria bacterium]